MVRLHLICTPNGLPVRFESLPAAFHDLRPVHELAFGLPAGSRLFGDKAFTSADDEATIQLESAVTLVTIRRVNMYPNDWGDDDDLHRYRHTISTASLKRWESSACMFVRLPVWC